MATFVLVVFVIFGGLWLWGRLVAMEKNHSIWVSYEPNSRNEIKIESYVAASEMPIGLKQALFTQEKDVYYLAARALLTSQISVPRNLNWNVQNSVYSILLRLIYSKEKAAEIFLNRAYFGTAAGIHVYGIANAAGGFFSKRVGGLTFAESSMLVVLLRAPSYYSPERCVERAIDRQKKLLDDLEKEGFLNEEAAAKLKGEPIQFSLTVSNFKCR